jgi:hypothetical protein
MRCDSARELFSEYTEGSIQAALRIPLETHLSECGDCRAEAEGLREVWSMLDSAPVMDAPADLRAVVWARIDARATARTRRSFRPAWGGLFTRRVAGWGIALLVVVALASVSLPGKYSPASFFFSFWGRHNTSISVSMGTPTHITQPGSNVVTVPLQWTGDKPENFSVSVERGSAAVKETGKDSIQLELRPGAAGENIVLRLQWTDNGAPVTRTLTVPNP